MMAGLNIIKGIYMKSKRKIKQVKANKDGWSSWQAPHLKGYVMGCCDCGLKHELEFVIVTADKVTKNGWIQGEEIPNARLLMRAKRLDD